MNKVKFPPVTVLPNYAQQVEDAHAAADEAREAAKIAYMDNVAKTVHPEYRLNRAERAQLDKHLGKVKLQAMFPIGTAVVEIHSRYRDTPQQKFNIVTSFTKAGYPKLDNGQTLKFETWMNNDGICCVARTRAQSYGWENRTYMACMWA